MKLVICDMDRTLLDLRAFHEPASAKAFKTVYEKDGSWKDIDTTGKTLEKCFLDLCATHKIPEKEAEAKLSDAMKAYNKAFKEVMPEQINDCIIPGAKEFLEKISKENSLFTCVVTGSSNEVASTALRRAGFIDYFSFIVPGDHQTDKADMVQTAIQLAETQVGQKFAEVIVIGDSYRDIDAGKAYKATTIGVLTGDHKTEDLKAHEADHIVENLTDPTIMEVLLQ